MTNDLELIFHCGHCGNRARHEVQWFYSHEMLYDEVPEPLTDEYSWALLTCSTCGGASLFGGFAADTEVEGPEGFRWPRLYPQAGGIRPDRHTVVPSEPIPANVIKAYEQAWFLRHTAPGAYANQIRRALEMICNDRLAQGRDLFQKLRSLVAEGILPPGLARIADLIREVGNIASHADEREVSRWDAELLDSLFRMLVEYVYVGPARLERLRQRLGTRTEERS
jgi:hypothetical protein